MADQSISVEVAYATCERQCLIRLDVPVGSTAGDAIQWSGIVEQFPEVDTSDIGVFGEPVDRHYRLQAGDRVEIYRPLIADPKDVRREAARQGKTVKRRR